MGSKLRFMHPSALVTQESECFRPPSFPPPDDWPVTVDKYGNSLSLYSDDYWDMNAFGFYGYNFAKLEVSDANKRLLKQALIFVMYHPKIFPGTLKSCRGYLLTLSRLAKFTDKFNIKISDLHRFPNLFAEATEYLQCSRTLERVSHLHKLRLYEDELGFSVGGHAFLQVLSREAQTQEITQHPYIPPRLWSYQVSQLNKVLEDFNEHRDALEKAYVWLHNAYAHNELVVSKKYRSPFTDKNLYKRVKRFYDGSFDQFLEEYGLLNLFKRWLEPEKRKIPCYTIQSLSSYLCLVRDAAIIFILNFSMQRKSEATSLRSDCFKVEYDKNLGNICIINGETTKTDPDSDARWVVPETVKKAVNIAAWIAKLRLRTIPASFNLPKNIKTNPYLLSPPCELWTSRCGHEMSEEGYNNLFADHRRSLDYSGLLRRGVRLFDENELLVTEEDARIALSMTPNLHNKEWFGIGKPWVFTCHQARRTLAVNMFASAKVSIGSIQHQMKHFKRNMTLYYGRNYSNIHLDSKVQNTLITEFYASIYSRLVDVAENEVENVRPYGTTRNIADLIELVDANEEQKLHKLILAGETGCRRTLLGFCMKAGPCEYGGIESISKCAGGNGICSEAIFVRDNKKKLLKLKSSYEAEIKGLRPDNMRYWSLRKEVYAIEVYLNVVDKKKASD